MKRFEIKVIQNFGTTWTFGINFFCQEFRAGLAYDSYNIALGFGKTTLLFTFIRRLYETK